MLFKKEGIFLLLLNVAGVLYFFGLGNVNNAIPSYSIEVVFFIGYILVVLTFRKYSKFFRHRQVLGRPQMPSLTIISSWSKFDGSFRLLFFLLAFGLFLLLGYSFCEGGDSGSTTALQCVVTFYNSPQISTLSLSLAASLIVCGVGYLTYYGFVAGKLFLAPHQFLKNTHVHVGRIEYLIEALWISFSINSFFSIYFYLIFVHTGVGGEVFSFTSTFVTFDPIDSMQIFAFLILSLSFYSLFCGALFLFLFFNREKLGHVDLTRGVENGK